jgi:hypothetical protein
MTEVLNAQTIKLLNITEPSQRTRAYVSQPGPDPIEPNVRTRATVSEPKPDPTESNSRTKPQFRDQNQIQLNQIQD